MQTKSTYRYNFYNIKYDEISISGNNTTGFVTTDIYNNDQRIYDDLDNLTHQLDVRYGFEIIINKDGITDISINSKQHTPSSVTFINNKSIYFETDTIQTSSWNINWSSFDSRIITENMVELYAGYTIDISAYYMRLFSEQLTGNYNPFPTYSTMTNQNYNNKRITIPHPSRSIVTNNLDYYNNFNGQILDNWFFTPDNILETLVYYRDSVNQITVKFLPDNTSSYILTTNYQTFKVRVSSNNNYIDNDLSYGTLLAGNLCRFIMYTDSLGSETLVGDYIKGWDTSNLNEISNNAFNFNQSNPLEAANLSYNNPDLAEQNRRKGWYLGVNISNIKATINLNNFPDIANRSGLNQYKPYTISFEQEFIKWRESYNNS